MRCAPPAPSRFGSLAGGPDGDAFEALLLRLRRRIGARARQAWGFEGSRDLYVASLSSRTVVYKGMVRSEVLAQYYADLRDPRFEVSFAVYHRRFSTNPLYWPITSGYWGLMLKHILALPLMSI